MAGFDHTRDVLDKIVEALKCKVCGNVLEDPHTVVGCGHFSCYECLMSLKLSQCPECDRCFYPSDLEPDNIARTVLSEWKVISSLIGVSTLSKSKTKLISVNENETKHHNSNDDVKKENKTESMKNNLNLCVSSSESEFEGFDNIGQAASNSEGQKHNSNPIKEHLSKWFINHETDGNYKKKVSLNTDKTSKPFDKTKKQLDNDDNNNNNNKSNKRKLMDRYIEKISSKNDTISSSCDIISATPQQIDSLNSSKKPRRSYSLDGKNHKLHSHSDKKKHSHSLKSKKERRHTVDDKMVTFDKSDEFSVNECTKNKLSHRDKNDDLHLNKDKKDELKSHPGAKDIVLNSDHDTKDENKKDKLNLEEDNLKDKSDNSDKKNKYSNLGEKDKLDFTDEKENKMVLNIVKKENSQKLSNDDARKNRSSSLAKDIFSTSVKDKKDHMKRNSKGETKLHEACTKGKLDLVRSLLVEGATPNTKDNAGWTPLHEAVERNNITLVEMLLDAGAYVNVPGLFNITPLLDAVLKDNILIARLLLQRGADINLRSNFNYVPMCSTQSDEMKKLLSVYEKQNNTSRKKDDFIIPMPEPTMLFFHDSIDDKNMKLCKKFCNKFGIDHTNSFCKETSHLVVDDKGKLVCSSDFNVLRAIVNGIPIISFTWIKRCLEENEKLKPDKWEIIGTEEFPNSKASMKSRQCAAKLLPKLLNGLHVYLSNYWPKNEKFTKSIATDLLRDAGAIILAREPDAEAIPPDEQKVMFHADVNGPMSVCSHVILYVVGPNEPKLRYNMEHIKTLSTKWLFNCIQTFSVVDPLK